VAPNGDLFFADSASNSIHVLRVPSGTASPTKNEVFASGLTQPFKIAFYPLGPSPEWVYVANSDGVVRFPYKNGDLIAARKPEQIVGHIPRVHHWTRDIAFTPDGKRLLLSVGSGSNVALDMFPEPEVKGGLQAWIKSEPLGVAWDTEERRADVLSYDPVGKNEKILATGRATVPASPFNRRPACPGASSTSAMSSATTRHSNMRPRSRIAVSTVGPGTTSGPTRTRATKARGRT
jgi:glucose/arabinose dehydrogenase